MPKMGKGYLPLLYIPDGAGRYAKLPVLTTTQRDALTAIKGMRIFNSTTGQAEDYDGSNWVAVGQVIMTTHAADPDAHHSEEIPDGRGYYDTTYLHTIPGVRAFTTYGNITWTKDTIWYLPIYVRTPITIDQVIIEVVGAAGAGEKGRVAIYSADTSWQPVTRQVASAEIAIDANAVVTTAITETTLQEGRYLIALTLEGNTDMRLMKSYDILAGSVAGFASSFAPRQLSVSATYAALPATGTAWDTVATGTSQVYYPVILRVKTP